MDTPYATTDAGMVAALEPPVSWSAIIAGAVVGLAVAILLTFLAAGFGYTLAFSGSATPASLAAFTPALGACAVAIQAVSAAFGGYIAGRLRHIWRSAHADEAHFRDTAHGLLAWALASVVGLVLAIVVFGPYWERLALASVAASALAVAPVAHPAEIAAQSAFFTAIGMLLSAFVAAVAARLGGLQSEDMHEKALARTVAPTVR